MTEAQAYLIVLSALVIFFTAIRRREREWPDDELAKRRNRR